MLSRPDFVVAGGQVGGKVYLWASRSLRSVSMSVEYGTQDIYSSLGIDRTILNSERTVLNADLRNMVMVEADSYPEAWDLLFREWAPPGPPEIEGRRALP